MHLEVTQIVPYLKRIQHGRVIHYNVCLLVVIQFSNIISATGDDPVVKTLKFQTVYDNGVLPIPNTQSKECYCSVSYSFVINIKTATQSITRLN